MRERRELASRLLHRFIWTGDSSWLAARRRIWLERLLEVLLWYAAVGALIMGYLYGNMIWWAAAAAVTGGAVALHAWLQRECHRLWQDLKQPLSRCRRRHWAGKDNGI